MTLSNIARNGKALGVAAAVALAALTSVAAIAASDYKPVTQATLLDRIQIEDLLVHFYYDMSQGNRGALATYFTDDGLLDVDSTIARGRAEITKLYAPEGAATRAANEQRRRGHMLLNNPVITIDGDRATAEVIWTGVMNDGVGKAPSLYEQGREYSELRKVNGQWLISKRCISSDSGTPDRFDATYKPRDRC
ncbi:MAG: nuclear transport factor 2 family protein [Nevskiaceae bacterium]|jgi:hypothetical protein|nr:nuclear transport factor 2 family protein [Nevskiaceae bacterium]